MPELDQAIAGILEVLDTPASRRLALDAWAWGQKHGEAAGVAYAEVIRKGCVRYVEHERRIRGSPFTLRPDRQHGPAVG